MEKGDFRDDLNADGTPKKLIDSQEVYLISEAEDKHTKDVVKEAIKEAIVEWLNEKFLSFGRWTFLSVLAIILAAVAYTILHLPGFRQAVGLTN